MAAKTSPARRAAFMTALAEVGNQSLAAERAKVSGTWVRHHRATDPDFRRESDAAIAAAKDRLRAAASVAPASGWRHQAGEELVVRGGIGRAQIARARLHQWTPRTEARFLAALAACCNVRAACRAVGMTPPAAYHHYNRWHDFAKRWDAALETGYLRLDIALLDHAGRVFAAVDYDADVPIEPMTFDQAISLLRFHQARIHGAGKLPAHGKKRPRSSEEAFASLAHKLDRVEKMHRKREAGKLAADRTALARGARIVAGR